MENPKRIGWAGRLFGHKFMTFVVESNGPSPEQIKESFGGGYPFSSRVVVMPSYTEVILRELRSEKYIVRCKRCGIEGEKKDDRSLADKGRVTKGPG